MRTVNSSKPTPGPICTEEKPIPTLRYRVMGWWCWLRNTMNPVRWAFYFIRKEMRKDPNWAHGWKCNIAMPIYDNCGGKLRIDEANHIADICMKHLFDYGDRVADAHKGSTTVPLDP